MAVARRTFTSHLPTLPEPRVRRTSVADPRGPSARKAYPAPLGKRSRVSVSAICCRTCQARFCRRPALPEREPRWPATRNISPPRMRTSGPARQGPGGSWVRSVPSGHDIGGPSGPRFREPRFGGSQHSDRLGSPGGSALGSVDARCPSPRAPGPAGPERLPRSSRAPALVRSLDRSEGASTPSRSSTLRSVESM